MAASRRRPAGLIALGAVFLIAAVVGFVVVPEHAPQFFDEPSGCIGAFCHLVNLGWSRTLYDALRIATWAVLIVGVLVVIVGLIGYARREPR